MWTFFRYKGLRQRLLISTAVICLIAALIAAGSYSIMRSSWASQAQNRSVQIARTIEQHLQREENLLELQIINAYASRQLMEDIEQIFDSVTFDDYLAGRLARSQATDLLIRSFPEYIRTYIRQHRSALYKMVFHGEEHTHIMHFETGEIVYSFNVPDDAPAAKLNIEDGFLLRRAIYNPYRGYVKIGEVSFHFRTAEVLSGIDSSGLMFSALRDYNGNYFYLTGDSPRNRQFLETVTGLEYSSGTVMAGFPNYLHYTKQDIDRYHNQIINGVDDYSMITENLFTVLALVAGVLILSAVSILLFANKIRYNYTETELKFRQKQTEMRAFQNQINPHFLYNTLEAISAQALLNNDKQTSDAIAALGSLFRDIVNMPSQISLKNEMRILETYLRIMEIKYGENFYYQISLEPELESFQTLKFWMQPLAENFFKHGFDKNVPNNLLIVRGYMDKSTVCVDIIDNGKSIPDERLVFINEDMRRSLESDSSIGIKNVYNRLSFFYGDSFSLNISNNQEGGVIIKMRVEGGRVNVQLADS